jgi:hypothetical protein
MWRRNRTAILMGAAALALLVALPAIPSIRRYARMKMM